MKNKSRKYFLMTGILFLLFTAFTWLVTTVDVRPIGPEHSSVGFATLNEFVHELFGVNLLWYQITDLLGGVAILFALSFGVLGLYQLIKTRSLWKVDYHILLLGIFYVVVIAFYILFELVVINYRPILLEAELAASYPSSHTMLVTCIMGTAILQFQRLFENKPTLRVAAVSFSSLLIVITVIGRLISGVHWFTDILAGILLSCALVMLYCATVLYVEKNTNQ